MSDAHEYHQRPGLQPHQQEGGREHQRLPSHGIALHHKQNNDGRGFGDGRFALSDGGEFPLGIFALHVSDRAFDLGILVDKGTERTVAFI